MKQIRLALAIAFAIAAVSLSIAALPGCSGGGATLDQRACPPGGTTLTFTSFGQPFFDGWCQSCHASNAASRNGAPPQYTFGSRDEAYRWRERIYARAGDDNATMPVGPHGPSADDRRKLGDWLSCGAPP